MVDGQCADEFYRFSLLVVISGSATISILITDCLQHDFVGPIDRFAGLPNALHVGHDESLRLLGPDPSQGPVARMVAWAHQQPDDALKVIHVRDWHDPSHALVALLATYSHMPMVWLGMHTCPLLADSD